jgi:hypothetical protein
LAIFFSRERLPWEDDPDWRDDLNGAQHLLGGLPDKDADEFLRAIPIESAVIREAIIDGAREKPRPAAAVYPLMLDLQVEHWRTIVAKREPITPTSSKLPRYPSRAAAGNSSRRCSGTTALNFRRQSSGSLLPGALIVQLSNVS